MSNLQTSLETLVCRNMSRLQMFRTPKRVAVPSNHQYHQDCAKIHYYRHVSSLSSLHGVKRLLGDFAATMSPEIMLLYVFIYYNWQYKWMQSSMEEIVAAYLKAHGPEALDEDLDESEGDSSGSEDESDA